MKNDGFVLMQNFTQGKPFEFTNKKKNRYAQKSYKYFRRRTLQRVRDKKRLRRIVKLRRIHLERYISVKYKGGKWWNKLMEIYFGHLTKDQLNSCKINTTSEIMLKFPEIKEKSKSFVDMFIFNNYPELSDPSTLKFLFHGIYQTKSKESSEQEDEDIYQLLVYKYKIFPQIQDKDQCYIVDPTSLALKPSQKLTTIKFKNIQKEHDIRAEYRMNACLKYFTSITDSGVLYDCLQYQQILKRHGYSHIDCQLFLMPRKLEQIHVENNALWDGVIQNYQRQAVRLQWLRLHNEEVVDLQTKLACRDRLLYFKKGFSDKTEDELQQALHQLQLQQKRLIFSRRIKKLNRLASYNDCKICFYPEVKQNNEIIFCIGCMVSYHRHCYGIQGKVDEELYICDACQEMENKDLQYFSDQRPDCEICFARRDFPLKKVDEHFYHISCLFFFNFVNTLSFGIFLKEKAWKKIRKFHKQNSGARCIYCLPQHEKVGFCLRCKVDSCGRYFHPICGYLRGSIFEVVRGEELQVTVRCHLHSYHGVLDDEIRQVFLRRFFCNLDNIQKINEQQFKPLYQEEKAKIQMELRKLGNGSVVWEEYDKLRKRQCKRQIKNVGQGQIDYEKMSIQELLSISKGIAPIETGNDTVNETEIYQQEEDIEQGQQMAV